MTSFREAFPILYVADVVRAVSFYESVFGFETSFLWPTEGEPTFAFLQLEPLGIALLARTPAVVEKNPDADFELCVYTDNADAAARRLRAIGATEVRPPTDEPWGERRTYFRDPDGQLLHVAQRL